MVFKSHKGETYNKNFVPKDKKRVEALVDFCGIYLERIDDRKTRMRTIFRVDFKLNIPRWFVRQSCKLAFLGLALKLQRLVEEL